MRRSLIAIFFSVMSSQVFAMDSLANLSWKSRVVLVFGDTDDLKLMQQVEILQRQKSELDDRDMIVILVSEDKADAVYGKAPALDAAVLRGEADIEGNGFHVVLVGKDGGIKLRSQQVVSDVEMFNRIDNMPMRRAGKN
jgi:hypothetical protein